MNTLGSTPYTVTDLLGADFDRASESATCERKLVVCATARSASYHLSKLLFAAGLGLPLEYFNAPNETGIATRLGVKPGSPSLSTLPYLNALYRARSFNGTFAVKLLYPQLARLGRGGLGENLFENATVVFHTRQDLGAQAVSYALAVLSNNWYEGAGKALDCASYSDRHLARVLSKCLHDLSEDEAAFRRFFALQGIRPLATSQEELIGNPLETVGKIADRLGVRADEARMHETLKTLRSYSNNEELRQRLKQDILPALDGFAELKAGTTVPHRIRRRLSAAVGKI